MAQRKVVAFEVSVDRKGNFSFQEMGDDIQDLERRGKKGFSSLGSAAGVLKTAAGTALGFLSAQALPALGRAIGEAVDDMSALGPVSQAFDNNVSQIGTTADRMIGELRGATRNLVSDFELMRQTNQAVTLGVAKNQEDFVNLAGAAVKLGRAVGQDAAGSIESLIAGVGRGSTEMLDNLGVVVKANEAYQQYAERVGKSTSELSDQEKRLAFVQAATEAVSQAAADLGEQQIGLGDVLKAIGTAWDNLRNGILQTISTSPELRAMLQELADRFGGLQGFVDTLVAGFARTLPKALQASLTGLKFLSRGISGIRMAGIIMWDGVQAIFNALLAAVGKVGEFVFRQTARIAEAGASLGAVSEDVATKYRELEAASRDLADRGLEGISTNLGEMEGRLRTTIDQQETFEAGIEAIQGAMESASEATDEQTQSVRDLDSAAGDAAGGGVSELKEQLQGLLKLVDENKNGTELQRLQVQLYGEALEPVIRFQEMFNQAFGFLIPEQRSAFELWERINEQIDNANQLLPLAQLQVDAYTKTVEKALEPLRMFWKAIGGEALTEADLEEPKSLLDKLGEWIGDWARQALDVISNVFGVQIPGFITAGFNAVVAFLEGDWKQAVTSAISAVVGIAKKLFGGMFDKADAQQVAEKFGFELSQALADQIDEMASRFQGDLDASFRFNLDAVIRENAPATLAEAQRLVDQIHQILSSVDLGHLSGGEGLDAISRAIQELIPSMVELGQSAMDLQPIFSDLITRASQGLLDMGEVTEQINALVTEMFEAGVEGAAELVSWLQSMGLELDVVEVAAQAVEDAFAEWEGAQETLLGLRQQMADLKASWKNTAVDGAAATREWMNQIGADTTTSFKSIREKWQAVGERMGWTAQEINRRISAEIGDMTRSAVEAFRQQGIAAGKTGEDLNRFVAQSMEQWRFEVRETEREAKRAAREKFLEEKRELRKQILEARAVELAKRKVARETLRVLKRMNQEMAEDWSMRMREMLQLARDFQRDLVGNSIMPDAIDMTVAEFHRMREGFAQNLSDMERDATRTFLQPSTSAPRLPSGNPLARPVDSFASLSARERFGAAGGSGGAGGGGPVNINIHVSDTVIATERAKRQLAGELAAEIRRSIDRS